MEHKQALFGFPVRSMRCTAIRGGVPLVFPWIEKAGTMGDLGEAAWTGMVCVETANVGDDARTLAPLASHVLEAIIAVERV